MDAYLNDQNKLPINVIRFNSDKDGHKCGYCKKQNTSFSFGTSIESYPVEIYEKMMKDGWRRCGDYVYIPNLEKSCCKLYTCLLNVGEFKINKDQIKVMKRFRKYLSGEYEQNLEKIKNEKNKEIKKEEIIKDEIYEKIEKIMNEYIKEEKYIDIINKYIKIDKKYLLEKMNQLHVKKNTNKKMNFHYSIDFIFVIRKIVESIVQKEKIEFNDYDNLQLDLFNNFKQFYNSENEILELFSKTGHINIIDKSKKEKEKEIEKTKIIPENNKNEIKIKEKKEKKKKQEKPKEVKEKYTFDYFNEIVNEPEIYLPLKHIYTLELTDKIQMNDEKFKVYKKYQMNIHKDEEDEISHERYNRSWGKTNLIDNIGINLPKDLASKTKHPEIYPKKYGCYNFIHRIDGKIVAVGIVDILPTCLSSVYLYYDTDYQFLDLGVLTSILEIEYTKSFHDLIDNNFNNYLLGFYAENIQKLRYKGFYFPTQILDRYTMNYVYLNEVQNILKEGKHVQLSKNPKNPNYEYLTKDEINKFVDNLMIKYISYGREKVIDFIGFAYNYIIQKYTEMVINDLKRFLEIIPKDLFKKIEFYAKFR